MRNCCLAVVAFRKDEQTVHIDCFALRLPTFDLEALLFSQLNATRPPSGASAVHQVEHFRIHLARLVQMRDEALSTVSKGRMMGQDRRSAFVDICGRSCI